MGPDGEAVMSWREKRQVKLHMKKTTLNKKLGTKVKLHN